MNEILDDMAAQGDAILARSGVAADERHISRQADVRYAGQGHEIRIDLPDGPLGAHNLASIRETFEQVYRSLFGRTGPDVPLEGVSWRVRGDCIVGSKGNLATQLHNSTRCGASNLTEGRTGDVDVRRREQSPVQGIGRRSAKLRVPFFTAEGFQNRHIFVDGPRTAKIVKSERHVAILESIRYAECRRIQLRNAEGGALARAPGWVKQRRRGSGSWDKAASRSDGGGRQDHVR